MHNKFLNALYEERRKLARALEKAEKKGDQITARRMKKEIAVIDEKIGNNK